MSPIETAQHESNAVRSFDVALVGFIVAVMAILALAAGGVF